jgi:hypothetical protein
VLGLRRRGAAVARRRQLGVARLAEARHVSRCRQLAPPPAGVNIQYGFQMVQRTIGSYSSIRVSVGVPYNRVLTIQYGCQ